MKKKLFIATLIWAHNCMQYAGYFDYVRTVHVWEDKRGMDEVGAANMIITKRGFFKTLFIYSCYFVYFNNLKPTLLALYT